MSFKHGNYDYFITLRKKKGTQQKEITGKVFLIVMGRFFES